MTLLFTNILHVERRNQNISFNKIHTLDSMTIRNLKYPSGNSYFINLDVKQINRDGLGTWIAIKSFFSQNCLSL